MSEAAAKAIREVADALVGSPLATNASVADGLYEIAKSLRSYPSTDSELASIASSIHEAGDHIGSAIYDLAEAIREHGK